MTWKEYEGIRDYLYEEFDPEIVDEFMMMLDIVEDNIDLIIENLEVDYENAVNDLFRMFHNLKSSTAFLKIDRISNYAHFVENFLDKMREKKILNDEIMDWLFIVSGQFHKWYEDIDKNRPLSPLDPRILKLPKV